MDLSCHQIRWAVISTRCPTVSAWALRSRDILDFSPQNNVLQHNAVAPDGHHGRVGLLHLLRQLLWWESWSQRRSKLPGNKAIQKYRQRTFLLLANLHCRPWSSSQDRVWGFSSVHSHGCTFWWGEVEDKVLCKYKAHPISSRTLSTCPKLLSCSGAMLMRRGAMPSSLFST